MSTFDPALELRKIAKAEGRIGGPKLSFAEQCAAFAALYEGIPNRVVRRAFGIGAQATSNLSGCLPQDPDPYMRELVAETDHENKVRMVERITPRDHNDGRYPSRYRHYQNVALEFEALGKDEFLRRYMTPDIIDRLTAVRRDGRGENGIRGRRPYDPERDATVNADGFPDFSKMSGEAIAAWRDANPVKWEEYNRK